MKKEYRSYFIGFYKLRKLLIYAKIDMMLFFQYNKKHLSFPANHTSKYFCFFPKVSIQVRAYNDYSLMSLYCSDDMSHNGICTNIEANNVTCDNTSSIYFQPIFYPEAPVWYYPVHYTLSVLHLILAIFMVICYFYENKHRIHFRMISFKKFM